MNKLDQYKEKLRAKSYYETLVDVTADSMIRDLSLKLYDNHQSINTCSIRYAQAELYYSFGDYETAIYKWCQVTDPKIIEWARLSIGDAYKESGLMVDAETTYQLLQTENEYLKMIRLLKQLDLYKTTNNKNKIIEVLRNLVDENIFFEDVYFRAIDYFVEQNLPCDQFRTTVAYGKEKFSSTIANELISIIKECNCKNQQINYKDLLSALQIAIVEIDSFDFTLLTEEIYYHARKQSKLLWIDYFSEWLCDQTQKTAETVLKILEKEICNDIEDVILENNYEQLIDKDFGSILYELYLISEGTSLKHTITALLIKWYENFPKDKVNGFEPAFTMSLEKCISVDFLNKANDLLISIEARVKSLPFHVGEEYLNWLHYYLNSTKRRIMLCGTFSNGKTSFINGLIGKEVLSTDVLPTTSAITIIQPGDGPILKKINNKTFTGEIIEFDRQTEVLTFKHEEQQSNYSEKLYELNIDFPMLEKHNLVLIDTPGFNDQDSGKNPVFNTLHLTDHMLYVLSAENALTKEEKKTIDKIKSSDWNGTVNFILNKIDYLNNQDEQDELIDDIKNKVNKHFGEGSRVIPFSSTEIEDDWLDGIETYFKEVQNWPVPKGRITKSLPLFEKLLNSVEKQHSMLISGLNKKKSDQQMKIDKVRNVAQIEMNAFNGILMGAYLDMEAELSNSCQSEIANLLKSFSNHISLERDYETLKKELETKMNQVLHQYFNVKLKDKTKAIINNSLTKLDQELLSLKERINTKIGYNEKKDGLELSFCSIIFNDLNSFEEVGYIPLQILPVENDIQKVFNNLSRLFTNDTKREEERIIQLKKLIIENDYSHVTRHIVQTMFKPLNIQSRLQEALNKLQNIEEKKVVTIIYEIERELEKLEKLLITLKVKYEENAKDFFPRYRLILSKWKYETGCLD